MNKLKFKSGIITGKYVKKLFDYAKNNNFAIPAINCSNMFSINAVLEAANIMRSPIIIQFSYNGSSFISGFSKKVNNNKFSSSIIGSILGALYIHRISKYYDIPIMIHTDHCTKNFLPWIDGILKFEKKYFKKNKIPLFSSHMIDLSNENLKENIKVSSKYLNLMNDISITLEIELGCTGGEEDIINNINLSKKFLYTTPEDVLYAYKKLIKINKNFIIAASFGNVHGVYKNIDIKLDTSILRESQNLVCKYFNTKEKLLNFVFHGGSGTNNLDIKKSIKYGVVKMNIDTDIQWASWIGIKNYYEKNKNFLQTQIGSIDNMFSLNKKYYDPRSWIRESQLSIINFLKEKFSQLNSINSI